MSHHVELKTKLGLLQERQASALNPEPPLHPSFILEETWDLM